MADTSFRTRIPHRVVSAWRTLKSVFGLGRDTDTAVHTTLTFRAVADAVVPRTLELAGELGPEHVPGGPDVGLGDFLVVYVNDLFQFGLPGLGARGNLPLAGPVANVLDAAALSLLERDANGDEPSREHVADLLDPADPDPTRSADAAGTFAELSGEDRLRAIGLLDEFEVEIRALDGELFEFDAGLVGQLVVGFTEMIYYSEWEGYGGFTRPPSDLVHSNDPAAVQSWRQTGYPGVAPGYAALRGYLGTDDGPLGDGESWTTVDGDAASPVRVTRDSGSFRENDYDTGDYEEPYPTEEPFPAEVA
ncbi:MAG: hypothetical protein V5A62_04300 [Haloarculaceae archaeon]